MSARPRPARRRAVLGLLALGLAAFGAAAGIAAAPEPVPPWGDPLDGTPRTLVIVGGSTSLAWPRILQEMLDEHSGGERVYHVLNAAAPDASVNDWGAEKGSPAYEKTVGAMVNDFFGHEGRLRASAPEPTIALCQFGADASAATLRRIAERLRGFGIERVYFATRFYEQTAEAETENKLMAAHWYRALAGPDASEAIIERIHARAYDVDALVRDYLAWRRGE